MNKNIFIKQDEINSNNTDISGKVTYTNIMSTIPQGYKLEPINNWQENYSTEWRWRFLQLTKNKMSVEISKINRKNEDRVYLNRYKKWVNRDVPKEYDSYVIKTCYYYIS